MLGDEENLCDNFIVAEIDGNIVGVMVKPGHQGMYTIFTTKRLKEMHDALHQIEAEKDKKRAMPGEER